MTDLRRIKNIDSRAIRFIGPATIPAGQTALVDFDSATVRRDLRKHDARWVLVELAAAVTVSGTSADAARTCTIQLNHPGKRALSFYIAEDAEGTINYDFDRMKTLQMNGAGSPLNQWSDDLADQEASILHIQTDENGTAELTLGGYTADPVWNLYVNGSSGTYTLSDGVDTTDPLDINASNETIQTALQDIASIAGDVVVNASDGEHTIHLDLDAIGSFVTLTADGSGLSGGQVGDAYLVNGGDAQGTTPYLAVVSPNGLIAAVTPVPMLGGE